MYAYICIHYYMYLHVLYMFLHVHLLLHVNTCTYM